MAFGQTFRVFDPEIGERTFNLPLPLGGGAPTAPGIATLTATADPGASQDVSQGYQIGSLVLNTTAGFLRLWMCYANTAGAAKWIFLTADYANGGTNPPNELVQGGLSTATFNESGTITKQLPGVAGGISPASIASDMVIGLYLIPANYFDSAGRGVIVTATGTMGANANNKRIKLWFNASGSVGGTIGGGTLMSDTGVITASGSVGGWVVSGSVFKRGAAGANTQTVIGGSSAAATTVGTVVANADTTAVENAAIIIAVTGNVGTALPDIALNSLIVTGAN